MVKYIAWMIAMIGFVWLFFSSCEDHIEQGIEGQWQMNKIIKADGSSYSVDTLYYSFKKGVFRYLISESEIDSKFEYGTYKEADGKLIIKIRHGVSLLGEYYKDPEEEAVEWIFTVKNHTSSKLELEFNDELLVFRKY